jgi:hypothetical protein
LMSSSAFPTSQVADYHLPLAGKTTFLLTVASVFPKLSSPKPLQGQKGYIHTTINRLAPLGVLSHKCAD